MQDATNRFVDRVNRSMSHGLGGCLGSACRSHVIFFQFKRLNQAIVGFPQDGDSARGRTRNDELKSRISHACVSKANAIWISPDQPELMKTSSCLIEFFPIRVLRDVSIRHGEGKLDVAFVNFHLFFSPGKAPGSLPPRHRKGLFRK